jgi:flagellar motor switch protein FliN
MSKPEPAANSPERRDQTDANTFRRSIFGVPVTVMISIGQKRLSVAEILDLQAESIIPLSARIDDPVDLVIDNKVIARGELIEVGQGQMAVKLTEIIEGAADARA